jgi:hypothetical protein
MAETGEGQKQNQGGGGASEAAVSEREARIAEAEAKLASHGSEGEAPPGARSEAQKQEGSPPEPERRAETRPPESVERYVGARLRGMGAREAMRASGLSGYMYSKWRDYINRRLEEAGLKEAEEKAAELRREAEEADRTIRRIAGEAGAEERRTERMKAMEELGAELDYARRVLLPKIMYGLAPERPSEASKAEGRPREGERREEPRPEVPMLIPIKETRYPDGRVDVFYSLGPAHYRAVRQTDMLVDQVAPRVVEELRAMRSDISGIGNRLFTLLENYWGPQLKKVQPWTYFPIPITMRTPAERERELEGYERRLEEKAPPPAKPEAPKGEGRKEKAS